MLYRIHIVACGPRTGTTLLTEMMINGFDIDLYTRHEDRIGKLPPRRGRVFLTKSPKDIIVVKPMLRWMRTLYVIYMLRDPRDMIVSRHGKDKERYWGSLRYWKRFTPFAQALEDHPRFITVRYEDLVTDPDQVQEELHRQMPFLQQTNPFRHFHQQANPSSDSLHALGGLRPVSDSSIGNWREHKSRVLGQIEKHGSISEDLIVYGYEEDRSWEKELEGVTPDLSESHYSVFFTRSFIRKKLRWNGLRTLKVLIGHTQVFLWLKEQFLRLKGQDFN